MNSFIFYVLISDQQWICLQVQSDAEELLIIKTRESLLDSLTEHVKTNHEYE
jgi:periplasmic divalent cation tolerance protein